MRRVCARPSRPRYLSVTTSVAKTTQWLQESPAQAVDIRVNPTLSARPTLRLSKLPVAVSAAGRTFHKVSKKYLPLYVPISQFRYNNRRTTTSFAEPIRGCEGPPRILAGLLLRDAFSAVFAFSGRRQYSQTIHWLSFFGHRTAASRLPTPKKSQPNTPMVATTRATAENPSPTRVAIPLGAKWALVWVSVGLRICTAARVLPLTSNRAREIRPSTRENRARKLSKPPLTYRNLAKIEPGRLFVAGGGTAIINSSGGWVLMSRTTQNAPLSCALTMCRFGSSTVHRIPGLLAPAILGRNQRPRHWKGASATYRSHQ